MVTAQLKVKEETFVCIECKESIKQTNTYSVRGSTFCKVCFDSLPTCVGCNYRLIEDEDRIEHAFDETYCEDCFNDSFAYCESCENVTSRDDSHYCDNCGQVFCADCYCECDNSDDEECGSNWDCSTARKPKITENFNTFGLEIECYNSSDYYLDDLQRDGWKCVGDGSLGSDGVEFVSPILTGKAGLKEVKDYLKILNKSGFTVNRSCGIHVHYGLTKEKINDAVFLNALIIGFKHIEKWVYNFVSPSRANGEYCKPIDDCFLSKSIKCQHEDTEILKFKKKFYNTEHQRHIDNQYSNNHYYGKRYYGLNIHSVFYRGSLELRYHNGSLNYTKIYNWIRLTQHLLKYIYKNKNTPLLLENLSNVGVIEHKKILPKYLITYVKKRIAGFDVERKEIEEKDMLENLRLGIIAISDFEVIEQYWGSYANNNGIHYRDEATPNCPCGICVREREQSLNSYQRLNYAQDYHVVRSTD